MPDYRTPGVYIEEQVATGPIAGVGTSTAAVLGVARRGPVATPTPVTNLTRFGELFVAPGPLAAPHANLVRAVRGFFENGGSTAYVVRVASPATAASVTLQSGGQNAADVLTITAKDTGEAGEAITVTVVSRADDRFDLTVNGPGPKEEYEFADVSMDPADVRFVGAAVRSSPVDAAPVDGATDPPAAAADTPLTGGTDDDDAEVGSGTDWDAALTRLATVDEANIICAPGITDSTLQSRVIRHCEVTQDRFAVLDAEHDPEATDSQKVLTQRGALASTGGFAALYHPWLTVADPDVRGRTLAVPPSGHVAGVIARVDSQRGVHKSPANELVAGALGLARVLGDTEHGLLNDEGVNVLRVFPGRSLPLVWGARTISDNTAWRYVNVRRLFLFVEESIQEGIRWAVFEPNDLALWKRLDRTITEFLTRVWSSGALFGATASEAFYVKIDEENNPTATRELGQVFIEVGLAPVRPAEFVVVRIGIWAGGGQAQEG